MTRIVISFAEAALNDLEGVQAWYSEQGAPEAGTRLVAEVFECVQTLAKHSAMGRIMPEFDRSFLRELIHPPFRILYHADPQRVRVVRVWRNERLLPLPG
jgi:toxin ParE1/3/4